MVINENGILKKQRDVKAQQKKIRKKAAAHCMHSIFFPLSKDEAKIFTQTPISWQTNSSKARKIYTIEMKAVLLSLQS